MIVAVCGDYGGLQAEEHANQRRRLTNTEEGAKEEEFEWALSVVAERCREPAEELCKKWEKEPTSVRCTVLNSFQLVLFSIPFS